MRAKLIYLSQGGRNMYPANCAFRIPEWEVYDKGSRLQNDPEFFNTFEARQIQAKIVSYVFFKFHLLIDLNMLPNPFLCDT